MNVPTWGYVMQTTNDTLRVTESIDSDEQQLIESIAEKLLDKLGVLQAIYDRLKKESNANN
jgi:hypothetical protein